MLVYIQKNCRFEAEAEVIWDRYQESSQMGARTQPTDQLWGPINAHQRPPKPINTDAIDQNPELAIANREVIPLDPPIADP
jgi:hypothetical protein